MMNASTDKGAWANPGATNPGATNRSPADLEREGEEIRADLDRTLDEIERKLSPGELLDRSVDFLRNNGSDFIREAGDTVRSNPIPVLLTAAGLIWLTTSIATRNRSRASSYGEGNEFSGYRGSEDYGDYGHNDGGIRTKVDQARSRMSNAAHRVGDRVSGVTDQMSGRAHEVADRARGRVSSTMHSMRERTQGARSDLMNLVQEQPVALGALALAAGALIGAALPITQYENRLVGPTRDRTLARAKEMGQREYEHLKQTVASSMERDGSNRTGSTERTTQAPEQG
jgi:ElaB/YqjD/DUF883 family membrane-anchored ribosome-binding protein